MNYLLHAVHVVAGLAPAYGGPSYSVPRLCEALTRAGAHTTLLSVSEPANQKIVMPIGAYRDCRFPADYSHVPILGKMRFSAALSKVLYATAADADVLHNHGIWLMPNVMAGRVAAHTRRPLVISTRGMLASAALGFSTLKKRVFWATLQGKSVHAAACLHATSEQEYSEIRTFGLTNPVAIVPNGIDVPPSQQTLPATCERVVIALGRIHPKKGLETLIEAWAKLTPSFPEWRLRIIGPDEVGYSAKLRELQRARGITSLSIECPLYGSAKAAALSAADLFVLPSLNENFGLTVAEALAAGTPVISTKGTPWAALELKGCGWWVGHGVESLNEVLALAMTMPRTALKTMGERGREWMVRDFSWERVAIDMLGVYRWLAFAGEAPDAVRFN